MALAHINAELKVKKNCSTEMASCNSCNKTIYNARVHRQRMFARS